MAFNIDLHTHTFFSGDGVSSPEENIAAARAKGLHGFAVTDHNTCDAITYLLDKGLMREDGQPVDDFLIIPGQEVTTEEGHLLCIGATIPDLKGTPAREVCEIIHERGGLAIPAASLRSLPRRHSLPGARDLARSMPSKCSTPPPPCAVTTVTPSITRSERGLPMTAASDAHHAPGARHRLHDPDTEDFSVAGVARADLQERTN